MAQPPSILEQPRFIDVGYGCRAVLSSVYPGHQQPGNLVPARHPGTMAFHTDLQDRPFLTIDLGVARAIKRIRVFNEESLPERAAPLTIEASADSETWHHVTTANYVFGGQVSNEPLVVLLRSRLVCRFVRLRVERTSFLHLDYVELSVQPPPNGLGRYEKVAVERQRITAEYHHHDVHGFSWTFTCTLGAIFAAKDAGIIINRIDYSRAMNPFKDAPSDDPYVDLFVLSHDLVDQLPAEVPAFERHGIYVSFPLNLAGFYVKAYFEPSERVLNFETALIDKYELNLSKVIAIVYRGTDKDIEINPAPVASYIEVAQRLLIANPDHRIVIQTDQRQVQEAVMSAIPSAIYFQELPMTRDKTVIHNLPIEESFGISRSELGVRLLAMIHLLARAKCVVTHTGNIGAWIALYRGDPEGLYQFDADGQLRDPSGAVVSS